MQPAVSTQTGITTAGVGKGEIVMRTVCMILCIGVLIPAAISISAIDKIKDVDPREELRLGFGDADDERRVALSLVCISSLAIAFQIVMIAVCILYITLIVKNLFVFYAFLNGIFSVLFAIAFFIGGTFNVFYAIDNGDRFNDAGCSDSTESEYCNDVQMLLATEAASTAASYISMILFGLLCPIMICNCVTNLQEDRERKSTQLQVAQPTVLQYPTTNTSHYVPPSALNPSFQPINASQNAAPSAPPYPHTNVSSLYMSTNAPVASYEFAQPPSYEATVATQYVPHYVPDGGEPQSKTPNESKTTTA